jgi:hypothetical protein
LSESKFRLLAKCLAAVLIPSLLAATVYYTSFINLNFAPKPAFAFSFVQGGIAGPTDALPQGGFPNSTLHSYNLGLALILQNGTEVHINDMFWYVHNTRIIPPDDPEFNGTIETGPLPASMSVMLGNREYIVGNESDSSMFMGGPTPIWGGVYYQMNNGSLLNWTLSTLLVTSTKTFDMGSYALTGEGSSSAINPGSIGYWPNASHFITNAPSWSIGSTDLSSFLQGSGNATIEFHASFSVHVNYTFYYPDNTNKTGETDASWNGTMGAFGIRHNDTGTYEIQYNWTRVIFCLVPVNNP